MQLDLPLVDGEPGAAAPARHTASAPSLDRADRPEADGSGAIVFVRRRHARRYILRVDADGRVRVTIPRRGTRRGAIEFVARHREWIARQRARLTATEIDPAERRSFHVRARTELPARLLELARRHGLTVSRISIRDQRTRWGSCGPSGHICLNWRLVVLPPWVRDYVLVHELMHLRRLDHSPAYWRLVAEACPEYRDARRWLREHGRRLR